MTRFRTILLSAVTALTATGTLAEPLTVYSPQGEERAVWITEQARAAGHDINILSAGGGELFDRLLAEKANPQADVVLGLIDPSMATLKAEGMFQAYEPAWAKGLPDPYRDDKDQMVYKFWQTPIVLAYRTDQMNPDEAPKSWLDLVKPEYEGGYVVGSIAAQTTRSYLVGILARFLDSSGEPTQEGWDFIKTFYDNAIVVDSGDAFKAAYVNGEAPLMLNWFGGARKLSADLGFEVQMIDTEGGTPFISEGIAIMAGTDQLDEAKAFDDWFGSPEFMASYAAKFGQVPVHPDAIAASPEQVQADAKLLTPQTIDWDAVAPKIDTWMQRIELDIK